MLNWWLARDVFAIATACPHGDAARHFPTKGLVFAHYAAPDAFRETARALEIIPTVDNIDAAALYLPDLLRRFSPDEKTPGHLLPKFVAIGWRGVRNTFAGWSFDALQGFDARPLDFGVHARPSVMAALPFNLNFDDPQSIITIARAQLALQEAQPPAWRGRSTNRVVYHHGKSEDGLAHFAAFERAGG